MDAKTKKQIKIFYFGLIVILIIIGSYFLYQGKNGAKWFFISGLVVLIIYYIFPRIAHAVYRGWMVFVKVLAWIQTKILLTIFFYLILCPLGLLTRLFRKDVLNRKFEESRSSYWIIRTKEEFNKEDYLKQY